MKFTSPLLLAALASSASAQLFGAPAGQPPTRTESPSYPQGSGGFGRPHKIGGLPSHTGSAPFALGTGTFGASGHHKGSARPSGKYSHDGSDSAIPTPAVRNRALRVKSGSPEATGGFGEYAIDGTDPGRPEHTGSLSASGRPRRKGGFARPSGHRSSPSQTGSGFALPTDAPKSGGSPKPVAARADESEDKLDRRLGGTKPTGTGEFARPSGGFGRPSPSGVKASRFRPSGAASPSGRRHRGGAAPSAGFPSTLKTKTRSRPTATP